LRLFHGEQDKCPVLKAAVTPVVNRLLVILGVFGALYPTNLIVAELVKLVNAKITPPTVLVVPKSKIILPCVALVERHTRLLVSTFRLLGLFPLCANTVVVGKSIKL
jgi:Na+-translocating ferredoxin:NAD+ oxidoreductase RnfE subunit